jgi:hypothetical protein
MDYDTESSRPVRSRRGNTAYLHTSDDADVQDLSDVDTNDDADVLDLSDVNDYKLFDPVNLDVVMGIKPENMNIAQLTSFLVGSRRRCYYESNVRTLQVIRSADLLFFNSFIKANRKANLAAFFGTLISSCGRGEADQVIEDFVVSILNDAEVDIEDKVRFLRMCARTLPESHNIGNVLYRILGKNTPKDIPVIRSQLSTLGARLGFDIEEILIQRPQQLTNFIRMGVELDYDRMETLSRKKVKLPFSEKKIKKHRDIMTIYHMTGKYSLIRDQHSHSCSDFFNDTKIKGLVKSLWELDKIRCENMRKIKELTERLNDGITNTKTIKETERKIAKIESEQRKTEAKIATNVEKSREAIYEFQAKEVKSLKEVLKKDLKIAVEPAHIQLMMREEKIFKLAMELTKIRECSMFGIDVQKRKMATRSLRGAVNDFVARERITITALHHGRTTN